MKLFRSAPCLALSVLSCALSPAALAADWKPGVPRTAYVNLFEWSWPSIEKECVNYLGPKGFAAVQVSPPNEHKNQEQWWSRYQPVSYKLQSRSGSRDEFKRMVDTCKGVGVDIYVDAVINHTANGSGVGTGGSSFNADNLSFPDMGYRDWDFHSPCISFYDEPKDRNTVTDCWMGRENGPKGDVGLPDLNTGTAYVQGHIADYLNDLRRLGVAGFRIDAAKHIRGHELKAIMDRVQRPYFVTQEIIKDGSYQNDLGLYFDIGTINEFSYGYAMRNSFLNDYGWNLARLPEAFRTWNMFPSDKATVFVANHDTERDKCSFYAPGGRCNMLSTYNGNQFYLAHLFMLAYDYGYPQIMSGYYFDNKDMGPQAQPYQGDEKVPVNCTASHQVGKWNCAHRDLRVGNMVGFRNYTAGTGVDDWQSDGNERISFRRGGKGFVAINNSGWEWQKDFYTGLPDGIYCNVTTSENPETGDCPAAAQITVSRGSARISVPGNAAVALHVGAKYTGGGNEGFDFTDQSNLATGVEVLSNTVTLGTVGTSVPISIRNGEYSVNGASFTSAAGTISTGNTLRLRTTSPATEGATKTVELTLKDTVVDWKVSTKGAGCGSFCPSLTPVDSNPAKDRLVAGQAVSLYYKGSIANGSALKLHWSVNGWSGAIQDTPMTLDSATGYWKVDVTLPQNATELDFVFTDGSRWDNNGGQDWKWAVQSGCGSNCGGSVKLTFNVSAQTRWGESVYITGDQPELGNWSTAADAKRKCDPARYPVWTCTVEFPQGGKPVQYKYIKLGLGTIWENGGNRQFTLPSTSQTRDDGSFR